MSTPLLLRGVDLAAVAAALVARLRGAGGLVSANGQAGCVQALRQLVPDTTSALYWAARLTLVNGMEDLDAFDSVFASAFGTARPDGAMGPEPVLPLPGPTTPAAGTVRQAGGPSKAGARKLPWATRADADADGAAETSVLLPDLLPSRIAARADEPFDRFDPDDLRLLGSWLEATVARSPRHGQRLARTRLGIGDPGANAAPPPAEAGRPGLRREPLNAAVRRGLPASDAGGRAAPGAHPAGGLRVFDVADPAHVGAVAPLGRGGAAESQRESHRPLRRHVHRPQRRRPAGPAARQRAARRGGDHRLRRLGQRSARRARPRDGPVAPPRRDAGVAQSP